MKFEWAIIHGEQYRETHRAKVLGGWIVRHREWDKEVEALAMIFIPDPKHEWGNETLVSNTLIQELPFEKRVKNCLQAEDIYTVNDLIKKHPTDLLKIPNFGHYCLKNVNDVLDMLGLALKG